MAANDARQIASRVVLEASLAIGRIGDRTKQATGVSERRHEVDWIGDRGESPLRVVCETRRVLVAVGLRRQPPVAVELVEQSRGWPQRVETFGIAIVASVNRTSIKKLPSEFKAYASG